MLFRKLKIVHCVIPVVPALGKFNFLSISRLQIYKKAQFNKAPLLLQRKNLQTAKPLDLHKIDN